MFFILICKSLSFLLLSWREKGGQKPGSSRRTPHFLFLTTRLGEGHVDWLWVVGQQVTASVLHGEFPPFSKEPDSRQRKLLPADTWSMNDRASWSGYLSTVVFRICFQILPEGGMILYSALGGDLYNIYPVSSFYPGHLGLSYLPNGLKTLGGRKIKTVRFL